MTTSDADRERSRVIARIGSRRMLTIRGVNGEVVWTTNAKGDSPALDVQRAIAEAIFVAREEGRAEERARVASELDVLRGLAAKVMPCHYCGVEEIAKCPHGFPGCALADDLMAADECANRALREEHARAAAVVEAMRAIANDGCGLSTDTKKQCPAYTPDHSEWCWCCIAREALAAYDEKGESDGA